MVTKIIIGSLNKTKLEAVALATEAFSPFLGQYEIDNIKTDGIAQPFNKEVMEGGILRAKLAYKAAEARYRGSPFYAVGIEGGIVEYMRKDYITAYCHIIKSTEEAHGSWTAFLELPAKIKFCIEDENCELGSVVERIRTERNWPWKGGAFGTLTASYYTRLDALQDALILAFSPFFIKI